MHVVVVLNAGLNVFGVVNEAPVLEVKHNRLCVRVESLALLQVADHIVVISNTALTFTRHVVVRSWLRLKLRVRSVIILVRLLALGDLLSIIWVL